MEKQLIIDALYGAGCGSSVFACQMQNIGLTKFIGGKWNEAWEWNYQNLIRLEMEELKKLYTRTKQSYLSSVLE